MKKNKYKVRVGQFGEKNAGFTILEVVIAIVILAVLASISVTDFVLLQKRTDLDNSVQEFIAIVKLAQSRSLTSDLNSQYGVFLNTSASPNQYILFKGSSYASRDVPSDQVYLLPDKIEFYGISLGGGSEIVFDRLTGTTENLGSVSFRVKTDQSQNKTIYILSAGIVSFSQPQGSLDVNRIKDSRHLVFDYRRHIDVASENITLTFNGNVAQQIPLSQYAPSGQLDWEGNVLVGGQNQKIHIHTNRLNNPDTQFSIFRDKRFNNKSLSIIISGDSSGSIAQYSADGSSVSFLSIYVSNFELK